MLMYVCDNFFVIQAEVERYRAMELEWKEAITNAEVRTIFSEVYKPA